MYQPPADLYPFKSHWLTLDGARMHYLDEGPADAPVVLMLHGNPTWSFYFRNLVLALRDRYRCIVPDHIGCGLSDKPGDEDYPYTLSRRIQDLDALIRSLDPGLPLNLVVHDWGGMIGFGWAAERPADIASMVAMNTAAFPLPGDKRFPPALALVRNTALGAWLVRSFNAFSAVAARVAFKKPVSKAVRRGYTGPYDTRDNRIATLRFVQDIPLGPGDAAWEILKKTEGRLGEFAGKPCLLAWGEKDFVFDLHFLARWRQLFPDATVLGYADCGHYVLEDAGPPLVSAIKDFLDNHERKDT